MKTVDHPNIVKMIDFFEDEAHYCLIMELMEGGELFDQILQREQFTESEARLAIRSIIDAIRYCHNMDLSIYKHKARRHMMHLWKKGGTEITH